MDKIRKTLDISKVLESRPKIIHDQNKLIGPSHKSIFSGSALIEWLLNNYNPTNTNREGLVKLVQEELVDPTLTHQVIYPVQDVLEFKDSDKALYRFIDDQFKEFKKDRSLLNLHGVDTSSNQFFYEQKEPLSILDVQDELKNVVGELFSNYLDESKVLVNYIGIEESDTFNKFLAVATKLAFADLTPILGDVNQIKAFFINIYNILVIHGLIAHHWTKKKMDINLLERMEFYASYKYNIGGHNYTLNDIEHGILRKNSPLGLNAALNAVQLALGPKVAEEKQERFKETDPRRKFVLQFLDSRIHFALNMGTISSPSLRYYIADEVDIQLEYAARDYCDKNSELKVEKDKTYFEFLDFFKHYKYDFAPNDRSLIYYILSYKKDGEEKDIMIKTFEEQKVNIRWKKFSWDLNKINTVAFSYHNIA